MQLCMPTQQLNFKHTQTHAHKNTFDNLTKYALNDILEMIN